MKRISLLAMSALLSLAFVLPGTASAQPPPTNGVLADVPITGTLENGAPFTGAINFDSISRSGSDLLFSGTVENAAGAVVGTFDDAVGILSPGGNPLRCDILFLDIGPIFLDLLGLEIDLSQIVLDIDAVPGAGNLLGNLLCAVVGLLDGGLPTGALLDLLDRILDRITDLLG
jgi:hypothetical protein